jgi:hypothetical protein
MLQRVLIAAAHFSMVQRALIAAAHFSMLRRAFHVTPAAPNALHM